MTQPVTTQPVTAQPVTTRLAPSRRPGAPAGDACVLHCGSVASDVVVAACAEHRVVCVDEDRDACRRVQELVRSHGGGTGTQVRLGPADVVVGRQERFDLIVDTSQVPRSRGSIPDVATRVDPTLRFAERQLRRDGVVRIQVGDRRQADLVRAHVAESYELLVAEAPRSSSDTSVTCRRAEAPGPAGTPDVRREWTAPDQGTGRP